jgi:hypothetical protein
MSQQRTSRAEFTRKAGTLGDLAATYEVPSAGTYPSSAARNTLDKRVALLARIESVRPLGFCCAVFEECLRRPCLVGRGLIERT